MRGDPDCPCPITWGPGDDVLFVDGGVPTPLLFMNGGIMFGFGI